MPKLCVNCKCLLYTTEFQIQLGLEMYIFIYEGDLFRRNVSLEQKNRTTEPTLKICCMQKAVKNHSTPGHRGD